MFSEGVMRNYIINSEKVFSHSEVSLIGKGKSGSVSENVPPAIEQLPIKNGYPVMPHWGVRPVILYRRSIRCHHARPRPSDRHRRRSV